MALLECREQMRHEVLGAGLDRQLQLPLQRPLHVRQLHIQAFQTPEDVVTGALQRFGGFREVQLLAHVFEQRLANQLFELADL